MKKEKFKVIDFIRELIVVLDLRLENFLKSEIEIKARIKSNSYDLLELAYEANSIEDVEKKIDLIYKMIAKIKIIDFLVNLSYDKKLIGAKQYIKIGKRINDIARYTAGWLKGVKERNNKEDKEKSKSQEELSEDKSSKSIVIDSEEKVVPTNEKNEAEIKAEFEDEKVEEILKNTKSTDPIQNA